MGAGLRPGAKAPEQPPDPKAGAPVLDSTLASGRTSCQGPLANQFRLVLHTAAYWLMLALRDAVPRRMDLAWAEFATIRQRLLKIGARVVEKAARVRIHPDKSQ